MPDRAIVTQGARPTVRAVIASQLRSLAAAFAFLTRIPIRVAEPYEANDLTRGVAYFPLVGLVVALTGALVFAVLALLWSTVIAVIISTAATVLFTGAFHEDGLADSFDGLGGGWDRVQVLRIMKDSRVGSYALVGMLLVIAAKIAALSSIADASPGNSRASAFAVMQALVGAHVLGRWSSVPLMWHYEYARPDAPDQTCGVGRSLAEGVTARTLVVATALCWLIVVAVLGTRGIAAIVIACSITLSSGLYFHRRLAGVTGDTLGAANQLVELAVYLTLAAHCASP